MLLENEANQSIKKLTTEEIHHAFHNALMGFLVKKVKDKSLAEDLFQDTLIKIHLNLDQLNDQSKLTSWIFQIARNIVIDYYRKKNPIANSEQIDLIDEEIQYEDQSERLSYISMSGCIEDMVNTLPEKYSMALKTCDIDGLSQKDAASRIGISVGALKSRLLRGRQDLKRMMDDCCNKAISRNCTSKITETSCGCQEFNI